MPAVVIQTAGFGFDWGYLGYEIEKKTTKT